MGFSGDLSNVSPPSAQHTILSSPCTVHTLPRMRNSLFPAAARVTFGNVQLLNFFITSQTLTFSFHLTLRPAHDKSRLFFSQQLLRGTRSALTSSPILLLQVRQPPCLPPSLSSLKQPSLLPFLQLHQTGPALSFSCSTHPKRNTIAVVS